LPITVDEFPVAQRFFPIVFSSGADSVPLALMGLNEGVNVYVDDEGKWREGIYVPAFMRRYPFLLARLTQDTEELSLCFDPSAGVIGDFEDGFPLFNDAGEPEQAVKDMLGFCEQFEHAAQRTNAFMKDLEETGLMEDGELSIGLSPESPEVAARAQFETCRSSAVVIGALSALTRVGFPENLPRLQSKIKRAAKNRLEEF